MPIRLRLSPLSIEASGNSLIYAVLGQGVNSRNDDHRIQKLFVKPFIN